MSFIFVFGSNLAGKHLGGAALVAHQAYKAEMGVGEGRTGHAYALPTLTTEFQPRSLDDIRDSIAKLVDVAVDSPDYFYVTRVGCGIAGFTDDQIAPLFARAIKDVVDLNGFTLTNLGFDPAWSRFGLPVWKEN